MADMKPEKRTSSVIDFPLVKSNDEIGIPEAFDKRAYFNSIISDHVVNNLALINLYFI